MSNSSEIERLKTALALTREHNIKLTEENRRLRECLRLAGLPPGGGGLLPTPPAPTAGPPPRLPTPPTPPSRLPRPSAAAEPSRLPPQTPPRGGPVLVKVHPDLMPPPPPPAPKVKSHQVHRLANQSTPPEEREAMQEILKEQVKRVRQGRRTQRRDVYDGSKPLRTQWPLSG